MKQSVFIADNPLDLSTWQEHETDDIHALLKSVYPVFPPTCRIYRGQVCKENDVTPVGEESAALLGTYTEKIYVVVYPAWAQVAAAALVWAVAWVVTQLTNEKAPKPREHVFQNGSPNNSLSDRSNRARLMERVPDIYGTVRSVPDRVQYPYIVYENHRPVETSLMCVCRNRASVTDIRENDTPFAQIAEASAVVYPPGQLPGGGTPSLIIGAGISDPVYSVYPVKSVNGQQLPPINAFWCYGSGLNLHELQPFLKYLSARFMKMSSTTGMILLPTNLDPDNVKSRIRIGDELQVIWGILDAAGPTIPDLSAGFNFAALPGSFPPGYGIPDTRGDLDPLIVTNVINRGVSWVEVHVNVPSSLMGQWDKIVAPFTLSVDEVYAVPFVRNINCTVGAQNRWLIGYREGFIPPESGGLFIDDPDQQEIWMNFVAPRGLYLEDGANRKVLTQSIAWRATPCDENGTPTGGPADNGVVDLQGSMIGGETRAVTVKFNTTFTGRCLLIVARTSLRVRNVNVAYDGDDPFNTLVSTTAFFRTTTFDLNATLAGPGPDGDPFPETAFTGSIIDDIQFTECYSMSVPTSPISGSYTLIHSKVVANESATRIEDRQLNCLATRSTGTWDGVTWDPFTIDTQSFGENMLFDMLTDPFIGNRNLAEIDFLTIGNAAIAVRTYFGDEDSTRFSYTFDDHNMSAEECIMLLCRAIFLTPYRQANVIKADPDIATDNSRMLFNHRNKHPGTESRTEGLGLFGDNDGVEQSFTNVNDGIGTVQPLSQFLSQPTVVAPLQSRIVGLRFKTQAWWHAYRQLARMIHQQTSIEFDALNEAGLIGINQRILVEDNTRPDVQDGEVTSVSGLVITTSQPVVALGGSTYTLFLQGADQSVEAISCLPGVPHGNAITMGTAPTNPIVTDPNFGVPTMYILVRDQDAKGKAFLVTDKQAKDNSEYAVQAINYSHMYFAADALTLWIVPSTEIGGEEFFDRSPYERPNLADNTFLGSDPVWGPTYDSLIGFLTNSVFAAHAFAYSKSCWVKVDVGTSGTILSSASLNEEMFAIEVGNLVSGHNAVAQCSAVVPGTITDWHHYFTAYDSATATLRIWIDGELADTATSVPTRALPTLMAFNSAMHGPLNGQAKHLRHWCRAWTSSMVRELYQKELQLP